MTDDETTMLARQVMPLLMQRDRPAIERLLALAKRLGINPADAAMRIKALANRAHPLDATVPLGAAARASFSAMFGNKPKG